MADATDNGGKEVHPRDGPTISSAKLKFLGGLSLFDRVSEPVLAEVAKAARAELFPAGSLLFQRGDPSTYLIAMEHGHIRISLQTRSSRVFVLQHVRGSAVVGEVGLLDGSTRTADATVVAETAGWVIAGRQYADLRARYPELAQAAIRHLCALVRYTTDHIETIALYSIEVQAGAISAFCGAAIAWSDPPARPGFLLDLNQSEIADLIGSSRPKVNQALVALERWGRSSATGNP